MLDTSRNTFAHVRAAEDEEEQEAYCLQHGVPSDNVVMEARD